MKSLNKNLRAMSLIGVGTLSLLLTACDKPTAKEPASPASSPAAADAPAAQAPKPVVEEKSVPAPAAVETVKAAAPAAPEPSAVAASDDQAKGIIEQVKTQIAASKYGDAASLLQKLSGLVLSSDQQTQVDALKAQVQQGLAKQATADGAKSVQGLIPKQP